MLRVLDAADGTRPSARRSPTPGRAAWRGSRTAPGFVYTRYPDGDQYHRTVHHHGSAPAGQDDPVRVGRAPRPAGVARRHDLARRRVAARPRQRRLGPRSTCTCSTARPGRWTTAIAGVEATTTFAFAADGASLVGVTTLDAPTGPRRARPARRRPAAAGVGDARRRGRRRARSASPCAATSCSSSPRSRRRRHGAALRRRRPPARRRSTASATSSPSPGSAPTATPATRSPSSTRSARRRRVWRGRAGRRRRRGAGSSRRDAGRRRGARRSPSASSSYPSLDGTTIGLFLIHRADVTPGPDVPAILNGYGGFAIAETPGVVAADRRVVRGRRRVRHRRAARRRSRRARPGTTPAAGSTSRTCSTTSTPPPTGSSPRASPSRERLAVHGRSNGGLLVGVAHDPAARPVPRRVVRRAAARHGALPAVPHRPAVDERVRRPRRRRGVRLAPRLLAVPPRRRRARATRRRCSRAIRGAPGPVPYCYLPVTLYWSATAYDRAPAKRMCHRSIADPVKCAAVCGVRDGGRGGRGRREGPGECASRSHAAQTEPLPPTSGSRQ